MKKIYIFIAAAAMLLPSCNNWLDINPDLEIRKEDMYESQQGFMDIITGAYISMAKPELYGRNTTVVLPELMANHWQVRTSQSLADYVTNFDFTQNESKALLEKVWLQYYQTILNLNIMLEEIESRAGMFTDGNYELIKGEALGLRGFLHLEVLRYWGAAPEEIVMTDKAIPYVTYSTKDPNQLLTSTYAQVFEGIYNDLDAAEKLLKDDPIRLYTNYALNYPEYEGTTAAAPAYPTSDFHFYRQNKFNYFAVLATKARYYSWRGDKATAANYARQVIDAQLDGNPKFELGSETNAISGDLTFPSEHIFSVYNSNATATLKSYFFEYQGSSALAAIYTQTKAALDIAYEVTGDTPVGGSDIRYSNNRLWEEKETSDQTINIFKKYYDTETTAVKEMPVIRLSEMYFLATENGDMDAFTAYRRARNLNASLDDMPTDETSIRERLEKEYRKEFYGEGLMFFFYKRNGYETYTWPSVKTVYLNSYKLPIPESQANFE